MIPRSLYMAGLKATLGLARHAYTARANWRRRHPPLAPAASLSAAFGPLRIGRDAGSDCAPDVTADVHAIMAGQVRLYGRPYTLGPAPDWWADPVTGRRLDPAVQGFDPRLGDIKRVWKLSCAHHLLLVAAHATTRGDAPAAAFVLRQMGDWIDANPAGQGPNWWSPTEVGLRLASWSLILLLLRESVDGLPATDQGRLQASLVAHGNHLHAHVEDIGLRTNHYVANLTGLYVLSLIFGGMPGAGPMRRHTAGRLTRALHAQTGADGVHREFSCHYHRLVCELFVLPLALARASGLPDFPAAYEMRLRSMLEVLRTLTNAGGILPQIGDNDSDLVCCVGLERAAEARDIRPFLLAAAAVLDMATAGGTLPLPQALELLGLAAENRPPERGALPVGTGWTSYPSAGWYVWRQGAIELLAVCGPVGSSGLGAHDHAHVNQVLLSLAGHEVVVDPGTGAYTGNPYLRNRLRSASAHSSLYAGREPACWKPGMNGLFHFETVWQAKARLDGEGLAMQARYGEVVHDRRVRPRGTAIQVEDHVAPLLPGAYVQWVLAPGVRIVDRHGAYCRVRQGGVDVTFTADVGEWNLIDVPYSAHFGHEGVTQALRLNMDGPRCVTLLEVQDA